MHAINEEYVSVAEAASLLQVAPSTIRRGIRDGDLPAYRLGKRRLALRRRDLPALITPLRPYAEQLQTSADIEALKRHKLTPVEVKRGLHALERLEQINKEILARRGECRSSHQSISFAKCVKSACVNCRDLPRLLSRDQADRRRRAERSGSGTL